MLRLYYHCAVTLDPDSAAAHTRLGITQFRLNKASEALAEFKKARELEPTSAHPYIMLGQLFTAQQNIEQARRSFEQAYKEDGKNEATARAYAEWLIQRSELDKAQQVAAELRGATYVQEWVGPRRHDEPTAAALKQAETQFLLKGRNLAR